MSKTPQEVSDWLERHPAPIHQRDVPAWMNLVAADLGSAALESLRTLVYEGSNEQQYQAMAAARCLGADVYADGPADAPAWVFRMPTPAGTHVHTG